MASVKQHLGSPRFIILFCLGLIPFAYRSPDGALYYLFDWWSSGYFTLCLLWFFLCLLTYFLFPIKDWKQAVINVGLLIVSTYFSILIVSGFIWLWNQIIADKHLIQDAEVMRKHRPNFHWQGITTDHLSKSADDHWVSIDLDSEGFRNPMPIPEKIGVAFLGDSLTFAAEVNYDELFTTLVSRELGLVGRNYGVQAIGTATEAAILNKYVLLRKPKAVVVLFYDNDPADNLQFIGWMIDKSPQTEKSGNPVSETSEDKTILIPKLFYGCYLGNSFERAFFRITDRSMGFMVHTPKRICHFYHEGWLNGYNCIPFLDVPLEIAEAINHYPGTLGEGGKGLEHWVQQVLVEKCPSIFEKDSGISPLWIHYQSYRYIGTRDWFRAILAMCQKQNCKVLVVRMAPAFLIHRKQMFAVREMTENDACLANRKWEGIESWDRLATKEITSRGGYYLSALDFWKDPQDFYFCQYDYHLNVEGHRALAAVIQNKLREILQIPQINQKQ